jgi:hypothetical protein
MAVSSRIRWVPFGSCSSPDTSLRIYIEIRNKEMILLSKQQDITLIKTLKVGLLSTQRPAQFAERSKMRIRDVYPGSQIRF